MATQPQAASTNPAANTPEIFGVADLGNRQGPGEVYRGSKTITKETPEVQAFQTAYPGMTDEAAIGSAILQAERASKPSMISSQGAKEQIDKDVAKLDEVVASKVTPDTVEASPVEGDVLTPEQEYANDPIVQSLKTLQENANVMNANLIRSIESKYARRKEQQKDASKRRQAGLTLIGQRAGRQRYAPEIQEGILGAEERAGIQALADLDAEEQMLVAQARQAKLDSDFKSLSVMMSRYDELQRQKTQKANDLFSKMVTQEKLALQKSQEARAESKFEADLVRQDIQDVMSYLDEGASLDSFSDEKFAEWEENTGISRDVLFDIQEAKQRSAQAQSAQDELDMQGKMVGILSKLPEDTEIEIGGNVYKGLKQIRPDTQTFSVTNNNGTVTYTTIDKETGKVVNTTKVKGAGKAKIIAAQSALGGYNKAFWSDITKGVSSLQKGENWGTVYDRIKLKHPGTPDTVIDTALGAEWREEGAYEKFKSKQYKQSTTPKWQVEQEMWKQLASPELMNAPREMQEQYIKEQGFNPEDFLGF